MGSAVTGSVRSRVFKRVMHISRLAVDLGEHGHLAGLYRRIPAPQYRGATVCWMLCTASTCAPPALPLEISVV